jgi:hypothetical protein
MSEDKTYFTPQFQRQLLALLVQNPDTYPRYAGIWEADYFDEEPLRQIARAYLRIRVAGNEHPTKASLFQELFKNQDPSGPEPVDVANLRSEAETIYSIPTGNLGYSIREVRNFAQQQALFQAINTSINHLQEGRRDDVRPLIDKALMVGAVTEDQGVSITGETRNPAFRLIEDEGKGLPIGIDQFDDLFHGGIRPGEMLTVLGGPGSFKSGSMLIFSSPALQAGRKITYISLEMPEKQVERRYAFHIARKSWDFLRATDENGVLTNLEEFNTAFNNEIEFYPGTVHIRAFGVLDVEQLRTYLDALILKGHETELLIVDYPDIMTKPSSAKVPDHIATGLLYAGVRSIAVERRIPVLVAAQATREALAVENLSYKHIASTMAIARHSDFIIAIIQTDEEKKNSRLRLKLLKNRNFDSGLVLDVDVDYPVYRFKNIVIHIVEEDTKSSSDNFKNQTNKKQKAKAAAAAAAYDPNSDAEEPESGVLRKTKRENNF